MNNNKINSKYNNTIDSKINSKIDNINNSKNNNNISINAIKILGLTIKAYSK